MYGGLDISVSGMIAQRTRMDIIAANIANRDTVADSQGNPIPYRRRIPVFSSGDPTARSPEGKSMGVHIAEIRYDSAPFRKVWDPDHPFAKKAPALDAGYVDMPNIDPVTEQINSIEAMRAYEANVAAAEATKSLVAQALRLIG